MPVGTDVASEVHWLHLMAGDAVIDEVEPRKECSVQQPTLASSTASVQPNRVNPTAAIGTGIAPNSSAMMSARSGRGSVNTTDQCLRARRRHDSPITPAPTIQAVLISNPCFLSKYPRAQSHSAISTAGPEPTLSVTRRYG